MSCSSGKLRWMPLDVAIVEGSVDELVAVLTSRLGSSILTSVGLGRVGVRSSNVRGDGAVISGGSDVGGDRAPLGTGPATSSSLSSLLLESALGLDIDRVRASFPGS